MRRFKTILLLQVVLCPIILFGQNSLWSKLDLRTDNQISDIYGSYVSFNLNEKQMSKLLATAPEEFTKTKALEIELPVANGHLESFQVFRSPVMEEGLAAKYPQIKTYLIQGVDDINKKGRISWTGNGLKAQIWSWDDSYYVQRIDKTNKGTYMQFKRSEMKDIYDRVCLVEDDEENLEIHSTYRSERRAMGDELRTYRLAVSTTGEYAEYHGGTIIKTLEAIVEAVTRLNVIYERECAIRFLLIDDNDELINLNADTDPFEDGNPGDMLGANGAFISGKVGSGSYDIGHVFATDGAGLASINSVCQPDKAEGVTGIFPPEGDAYVVEYLAHEIGHQFGAHHSFNKCPGNEVPNFAYEPGSGSTIMSYAGLCGSNNVTNGSLDYFHVVSLAQIDAYTRAAGGNCAEDIDTGNTIPEVEVPEGGFYIPINTPFELDGEGTDADDDALTYCWEQYDLGPSSDLGDPRGSAPLFRSFKPTVLTKRVFPRMNLVLDNLTIKTEVLPSTSRDLTFRLTVRDNKIGSGGSVWDEVAFGSTNTAGPFVVTSQQNSSETWIAGTKDTVTWDVAGTNNGLVDCQEVDIYLSRNLGLVFDILLAENVPNNGSAIIDVPADLATNFARIKVKASNNVFFNVNKSKFKIVIEPVSSNTVEESEEVIIYPNPATESLSINLANFPDLQLSSISLFAADGKLILEKNNSKSDLTLDVRSLPNGIYILQVKTAKATLIKKVLIQSKN